MAVFVARGSFEEIEREFFGESFGDDDDTETLTACASCDDEVDDVIDEYVDIECASEGFTGFFHQFGDIFDADDHLCFACHGDTVSQPTCFSSHAFGDEVGAACASICNEVTDFLRHEVDGGKVTEGEVDAVVVIVDGFGEVNNANFGATVVAHLIFVEFVGGFEGIVAADGDEGIDTEAAKSLIGTFEGGSFVGIVEVIRACNHFTRVCTGSSDHDTALIACADDAFEIEDFVGIAFDERHFFFVKVLKT